MGGIDHNRVKKALDGVKAVGELTKDTREVM